MYISYILYCVIGKLLIYLGMKFPPFINSRFTFIRELFACDECLGVWVYVFLSFAMNEVLFQEYIYLPVIGNIITGAVTSFLIHLVSLGWKSKFEVIVID